MHGAIARWQGANRLCPHRAGWGARLRAPHETQHQPGLDSRLVRGFQDAHGDFLCTGVTTGCP
jgi:hypothetical protein